MERTLVIIKPDGVRRGLTGEILARLEGRGLRVAAAELRTIDEGTAKQHYAEHEGRDYFDRLVTFIASGPSMVMIIEGPTDTWRLVRTMMGPTNPVEAPPGTIRGDFATDMAQNVIHGSDSTQSAEREIAIFFPHLV